MQHEYTKNPDFAIADNPELVRIFAGRQNRRVTVPNPVVDQFFEDSLEFGIPMVQTAAGIFARPAILKFLVVTKPTMKKPSARKEPEPEKPEDMGTHKFRFGDV